MHKFRSAAVLPFVALLLLAVACSSSSEGSTDPTPVAPDTPTSTAGNAPPTPQPVNCPIVAEACVLAQQLKSDLESGNTAAIVARHEIFPTPCDIFSQPGPGGARELCSNAAPGEVREGYQTSRRYSEGAVLSRQGLETAIAGFRNNARAAASDKYGNGALKLQAVACTPASAAPAGCKEFSVLFSAITGQNNVRELLIFVAEVKDGKTVITLTKTGIALLDEEDILYTAKGGTLFDLGRVYPIQ